MESSHRTPGASLKWMISPLRAFLVAVSVALLLAGDAFPPMAGPAEGAVGGLGERVRQGFQRSREKIRKSVDRSRDRIRRGIERSKGRVRQKLESGRRKLQEKFRRGGARAREAARRQGEKLRRWHRSGKEVWKRKAGSVRRKAEQLSRNAPSVVKERASRLRRRYGPAIAAGFMVAVATVGLEHREAMGRVSEKYGKVVSRMTKDEEDRAKVLAAIAVATHLHTYKKAATYSVVKQLGRIPVRYGGESTTLESALARNLSEKCPMLRDSDIVRDPAKAVTYGLIYHEPDYIFGEMKILKGPRGRTITMADAMYRHTGDPARNALSAMRVMDRYVELANATAGMDLGMAGAASEFQSAVISYNSR